MADWKVSVIIPTLNAGQRLPALLQALHAQTVSPHEIIVVDSQSDDGTAECAEHSAGVRLVRIARETFDHGGTRDFCLRQSTGDIVCFLTQDAIPQDERYLQELIARFAHERVACVCGRQVARKDALPEERLTRLFNYPDESFVRDQTDLPRLGIKAFFLSDVCSAYRRSAYEAVGGFEHPILTNEDMLIAARFIHQGYAIAYCAKACVVHSHGYTLAQDYRRSYDIGAFLAMHRAEFQGVSAESEGMRYVLTVSKKLLQQGNLFAFVRFGCHCVARFLGRRNGARYEHCTPAQRIRQSSNPAYWRKTSAAKGRGDVP